MNGKVIQQFLRERKKTFIVAGLVLCSLFVVGLLLSLARLDVPLYTFTHEFTEKTGIPLEPFLKEKLNVFFRIVDEINLFSLKKNLLDGTLPAYNLQLSPNDIRFIEELSATSVQKGYLDASLNKWRDVTLEVNGETYPAKIKLHGDILIHWSNNLKSYKVKVEFGSLNHIRRFNLILFEDRHLTAKMSRLMAQDLGLYDIRDDIVVLQINGVLQGMYYLQESLEEDFFEYNRCSSCVLLQTTDNFLEDHPDAAYPDLNGVTDGQEHGTDFDQDIGNLDFDPTETVFNPQVLAVADYLFAQVAVGNQEQVMVYFDKEQVARFEAFLLLIGSIHPVNGDNLRLAYSASTGKFYPLPLNEALDQLLLENGGVEHMLSNENALLFRTLATDEEVRHLRNKILYTYVSDDDYLQRVDALVEHYRPYALSYKTNTLSRRYITYRLNKDRYVVASNFEIIKRNMEYAKSYLNAVQKGNMLAVEVVPDSIAEIRFDQLQVNLSRPYSGRVTILHKDENNRTVVRNQMINEPSAVIDLRDALDGFYFSAGLDEQMFPQRRVYSLEITFPDASAVEIINLAIKMSNDITGKPIASGDLYVQLAAAHEFEPGAAQLSFPEFQRQYPELSWAYRDGVLTLQPGSYTVREDIIVPSFSSLVLEAGTTIALAEDVAILSYAPLQVRGTAADPVIVRALDQNRPFGSVGVVGNKQGKVLITGLDFSGGNEKVINGLYLSAGLSIHNIPKVEIRDSKIYQNHADDGLNIKYATVFVDNVEFADNFADHFDCDFCTGAVQYSRFLEQDADDANGDGLDLSGSEIIVKESLFQGFKDKGVSIGEETKVILFNNVLRQNNLGVAVKDSSHVFLIGNMFADNNVSLAAYQKKELFGGATGYLYQNTFSENNQESELDATSKLYKLNFRAEDFAQLRKQLEDADADGAFALLERYGTWKSSGTN